MMFTIPMVMYGIFRVLYLQRGPAGVTEDPSAVVWKDRPLQACIALWAATAGLISALS